jgi:hypothetical protein
MDPIQRAAIAALTRIVAGELPSAAIAAGIAFTDATLHPQDVSDLAWKRVRVAIEDGAHQWLEMRNANVQPKRWEEPTGLKGVGYRLSREWFPVVDRRGEEVPPELMGELVRGYLFDWWHTTGLQAVA